MNKQFCFGAFWVCPSSYGFLDDRCVGTAQDVAFSCVDTIGVPKHVIADWNRDAYLLMIDQGVPRGCLV